MARWLLTCAIILVAVLGGLVISAANKLNAGSAAKEESLSITANAAAIDLRQPQTYQTATFALG